MLAIIGMLLDRSARSRESPTACQPNSVFRENIPQGVRERPQCIGSAHLEEPSNPWRSWGTWSSVSRSANGCLQEGPYHLQGGEVCSRGPRFFFCCVALYPRKRTSHETSRLKTGSGDAGRYSRSFGMSASVTSPSFGEEKCLLRHASRPPQYRTLRLLSRVAVA